MSKQAPSILIADDEPSILASLQFLAMREGWRVIVATDGASALQIALTERPDLILLDVMLPQIEGIEVCRRLRADTRLSETSIVLLSAKSSVGDIERGHEAGADLYLGKPFSTQDLMARLRALLRSRDQDIDSRTKN